MRNVASVSSDESSILILFSREWSPAAVCSAMRSLISWWINFFLSLFITFRTNVRMSIIPSPCSFFFALHFEWSLNLSTDKKSNAICIFANLCSTLFSRWFKFLHLGSTSCENAKKRGKKLTGKHLNVDRQFLKDVMRIFWCYCV